MAEFQEVVKNFKRMCNSYEACEGCPMSTTGTARSIAYCRYFICEHFEESECIIMQWAKENPIKTNRDKFKEVFGMDLVITGNTNKWLDQEYKGGQE